jgi:hypothetical protein
VQTAPLASQIINETASTGDAWIRQRKQPLWRHKLLTKLLPRVTLGLTAQKAPRDYKIINKTTSTGDAWIRQRKQPLWPQK